MSRKKRRSLEDAWAPVEPAGLLDHNQNARELLLTRIASQSGLPRGYLQLEVVEDAPDVRRAMRVLVRCSAMLQPSTEWAHNQSWLSRQGELVGAEAPARTAPGSEARAARRERAVTFDVSLPRVIEIQSSGDAGHCGPAAAVAAAAAGESDPAAGFDQLVRV